jgi:hypothetical protein
MAESLADDDGSDRHGLLWFLLALVLYVALGLVAKSVLLNWVIGPLFPLVVIGILPAVWKSQRGVAPSRPNDWPDDDDVSDPYGDVW